LLLNEKLIIRWELFGYRIQGGQATKHDRRRWDDNIKIDFKLIGWEVMDGIHLAQKSVGDFVNTVMNL
jgi:hypothetical protein